MVLFENMSKILFVFFSKFTIYEIEKTVSWSYAFNVILYIHINVKL